MGWAAAFGVTAVQPVEMARPAVSVVATRSAIPTPSTSRRGPARERIRTVAVAHEMVVPKNQVAVDLALKQVGKPYQWGSKGPNSFDCSGLVQWSYRQVGVTLGPDTYTQVNEGTSVKGPPKPGDLIFPAAAMGSSGPHHVVLAISATQAVEAPGRGMTVRVIPMPIIGEDRRVV